MPTKKAKVKTPVKGVIKIDLDFFKSAYKHRGLDYGDYKKAIMEDLKKKK